MRRHECRSGQTGVENARGGRGLLKREPAGKPTRGVGKAAPRRRLGRRSALRLGIEVRRPGRDLPVTATVPPDPHGYLYDPPEPDDPKSDPTPARILPRLLPNPRPPNLRLRPRAAAVRETPWPLWPPKSMSVATTILWGGHSWRRAGFPAGSRVGPPTTTPMRRAKISQPCPLKQKRRRMSPLHPHQNKSQTPNLALLLRKTNRPPAASPLGPARDAEKETPHPGKRQPATLRHDRRLTT